MADWPVQADYRDALQNPRLVLRADRLKVCPDGEVERNHMKVPKARAGAFATVYKLVCPAGPATALKLFNFASPDRERRYRAVVDHLKALGPNRPPSLVEFNYETEGIKIKRGWYPVQTMAWVKGVSLGEWFRVTMGRRDTAAVRRMADLWVKLVAGLQAARIAHGDLQHDNVMVVNDAPVLVDYDGMVVPALVGADPLEFGKPAYQHPRRAEQALSLGLDHFPAWVILIALRAVAADPGLYARFVTKTDNENLLFSPDDLQAPDRSKLWPELVGLKADPEAAGWARDLRACLDRPFDQIPPFAADPAEALRRAKDGDWAEIAAQAARLDRAGKPAPPDQLRRVDEARRRVAARDRVQAALAAGDPRAVVAAFDPPQFAGWADAIPVVTAVDLARSKVQRLDRLKAAAAAPGDGRAMVALWDACAADLAGVPEAAGYKKQADLYKKQADEWRRRDQALERFRQAAANPAAAERDVAAAWEEVGRTGPHAALTPADRARGEAAARRAALLAGLGKIPKVPSEAADRALTAAWDGAALGGCREADPYRPLVAAAADRLRRAEETARAVRAGDKAAVLAAAAALPAGYAFANEDRVRQIREEVRKSQEDARKSQEDARRRDRVDRVLSTPGATDTQIADAWEEFKKGSPRNAPPVPQSTAERCELATRRRAVIRELAAVERTRLAADRQDKQYVELMREHRDWLRGSPEIDPLRPRLALAERRLRAWSELYQALKARDPIAVRRLAAYPDLADYPPVAPHRARIAELTLQADRVERVLGTFRSSGPGAAPTAADMVALRESQGLLGPDARAEVEAAVRRRLASRGLVPGTPPYQIVPGAMPMVRVNWGWSEFGLLSSCLVALDANAHLDDPAQANPYDKMDFRTEDHQRGGGGAVLPLPPQGEVYVTIWPVVDLGWTKVHGPPLHVGPITAGRTGRAAGSGRGR